MELLKDKVYYKDQHPEEWEYMLNNDVGRIIIMYINDNLELGIAINTPYKFEAEDYAFMLMPKPPKPKTLLEKVADLRSYSSKNEAGFVKYLEVINLIKTHEGPIR